MYCIRLESNTADNLYFPPRVEAGLTQLDVNTGFNDVNIVNVNTCDGYLPYNSTSTSGICRRTTTLPKKPVE